MATSVRSGKTGMSALSGFSGQTSASGTHTHSHSSSMRTAALLRSMETAVMGSFQVMQKKHHVSEVRSYIGLVIRTLQMLAFVLTAHADYHWKGTITPLRYAAELTTVAGYMDFFTPAAYIGIYYAGLAYVAVFLGLFVWATQSFMRNHWPVLWPLRLLSAMGSLSATTLYIPLFYILMSGYQCTTVKENEFWHALEYQCYAGGHLAQTIIAVFLTLGFVVLCALFTLVYFDANPLSVNVISKAHGRADFVFLIMKTILVVLVEVYPHSIGVPALVAVVVASGVVWVCVYATLMPFYNHIMNKLMLAAAFVYLWAGLCLILAEAYSGYDAAVALYMGAPLAALAGSYLASWRAVSISRSTVPQLRWGIEVELKARYFLHEALWGHPVDKLWTSELERAAARPQYATPAASTAKASSAHANSAGLRTLEDMDGQDDTEAMVAMARRMLTPAQIKEAEGIYRAGMLRFKHSSMLHVLAARFFSVICDNHHLEMSNLIRAERRHPRIDEKFLIFQARRSAEDSTGSRGSMSALNRVSFEKHLSDARAHMQHALARQVQFWSILQESQPDLTRMHRLCSQMNASVAAAERAFQELLGLNSQSLMVIRLYAEFNQYVINNPDKASLLAAEAERIEEQQAKDHQRESGAAIRIMEQSNLDVMADNTAMITIGGQPANLGMILTVSPYACKLFGYSRWQMERRNINMIIPQPLADMHDGFLRGFAESGVGRVVNYTRVIFGQHRLGHIFPLLLAVRETPATDGPPAFVGIMRTITASEEHLLLTSEFRITAATQSSLVALGVQPSALLGEDLRIQDFVPEWDAILTELRSAKGTTLCIDAGNALRRAQQRQTKAAGLNMPSQQGPDAPREISAGDSLNNNSAVSITWVRAHLQEVGLPGGDSVNVLHWQHLPSDKFSIQKAQVLRRASLSRLGAIDEIQVIDSTAMQWADRPAAKTVQEEASPVPQSTDTATSQSADARRASVVRPLTPGAQPLPTGHPPVDPNTKRGCPVMIRVNVMESSPNIDAKQPVLAGAAHLLGEEEHSSATAGSRSSHSHQLDQSSRDREPTAPDAARDGAWDPALPGSVSSPTAAATTGLTLITTQPVAPAPAVTSPISPKSALRSSIGGPSESKRRVVVPGTTPRHIVPAAVYAPEPQRSRGTPPSSASAREGDSEEAAGTPHVYSEAWQIKDTSQSSRPDLTAGVSAVERGSAAQSRGQGVSFAQSPEGDGDRSSYASSRRSATRKTQDRLRRLILDPQQTLLPGLRLMRIVGHLMSAITLLLGIAITVFVVLQVTAYSDTLAACMRATDVMKYGLQLSQETRELAFAASGWEPQSTDDEEQTRQFILTTAQTFNTHHRSLYDFARSVGVDVQYVTASVNVSVHTPSADGTVMNAGFRSMSLLEAGLMYVAAAEDVARTPLQNLSTHNPSVRFVLDNGLMLEGVHDGFNSSIWEWFAYANSLQSSVTQASVAAYASVCVILAVMALAVVLPIVITVDKARDSVVLPFVALPTIVPAKLRALSERQLRRLQMADEDEEEEDNNSDIELGGPGADDEDGADDVDWDRLLEVDQITRNSRGRRESKGIGSASGEGRYRSSSKTRGTRVRPADASAAAPSEGTSPLPPSVHGATPAPRTLIGPLTPRRHTKSARSMLSLALRFSSPLVLVLIFFTVIYIQSINAANTASQALTIALVANNRNLEMREVAASTDGLVAELESPQALAFERARALTIAAAADYHNRLLTYGAPAEPIVTSASRAGTGGNSFLPENRREDIRRALFQDACDAVMLNQDGREKVSAAECRSFGNGMLKRGLQAASVSFLTTARAVQDRRMLASVPFGSTGVGTITINNVTSPYTVAQQLNSADVEFVDTLGEIILPSGFQTIADIYEGAAVTSLEVLRNFLIGWLVAFLVVFWSYQIIVFQPQVFKVNKDIKDQRVMLLLLPHQVVAAVPGLRVMMQQMLEVEEKRAAGWRGA